MRLPRCPRPKPDTALAMTAAILLLFTAWLVWAYRLPAPLPSTAAAGEFSAQRAIDALTVVLGDQSPHPVGSSANAAVRERILGRLRALGYQPETLPGYYCDRWDICASVVNILVRIPSREPGPAILLSSHYDSVAAAPGAADDGIGIAVSLEIARLLQTRAEAPRQPVWILITDGEELSLSGAESFVAASPLAAEVGATVNLDAIGNSGPAFLFQTGRASAELIASLASAKPVPVANSAWQVAFRRLPNDTDFSVFRRAGWQGYNYALFDRIGHYHTPLDNLSNLDPRSVQQMGDSALAALDSLVRNGSPARGERYAEHAEPGQPRAEDSVHVDIGRMLLVQVSASTALILVLAMAGLLALIVGRQHLRQPFALRPILSSIAVIGTGLLLSLAAALGLLALLRAGGALHAASAWYGWIPQPLPMLAALAVLALSLTATLAMALARIASAWTLWLAVALLQLLATLLVTLLAPNLAAALAATLAGALLPGAVSGDDGEAAPSWLAGLLPLASAWLLMLPSLWFSYPILGVRVLPLWPAALIWALLPALPLLCAASALLRRCLLAAAVLGTVIAVAAAMVQPLYTGEHPQRLNLEYREDADRGSASWIAEIDSGLLPAALLRTANPSFAKAAAALPWSPASEWQADTPALHLPPPQFEILSRSEEAPGRLRIEGRLRSLRGARMVQLCVRPDQGIRVLSIETHSLPVADATRELGIAQDTAGWRCVEEHGLRPDGVRLVLDLPASGTELLLIDRSDGLPASGTPLLQARPVEAVPSQDGDVTRVFRRQPLLP